MLGGVSFPTPTHGDEGVHPGKPTTFAVVGHTSALTEDGLRLSKFLDDVNTHMTDAVFILGDAALYDASVVATYREHLDAPVYFAPGNHDLEGNRITRTQKNLGYLQTTVELPCCSFVLINSSDGAAQIRDFLDESLSAADPDTPTILMSHFRVWDDTLLSPGPFQHDKSYRFSDLYDAIDGRFDYLFTGNSKRQYMSDIAREPGFGKQNVNNIYWAGMVGSMVAYSVGMGDGDPRAGYVTVHVAGFDRFEVRPHHVTWTNEDIVGEHLIVPDTSGEATRAPSDLRKWATKRLGRKHALAIGFLLGAAGLIATRRLATRLRRVRPR